MKDKIKQDIKGWPTQAITVALLGAGLSLIAFALIPDHFLLKALVLAWVLLP